VSHIEERKEKDCLNCGALVQGRFCQTCGQENVVPHETFTHMVKHFVFDIFHFDSKFFDSMKFLFMKPGFLPQEYIKGRRVRYLNPVKKYVFTSAIFFLFFFGFFINGEIVSFESDKPLTTEKKANLVEKAQNELKKNPDSKKWKKALVDLSDTSKVSSADNTSKNTGNISLFDFGERKYQSLKEYDSIQKQLPASAKDGWLKRIIQKKNIKLNEKYKKDPRTVSEKLSQTFLHNLPYLLFLSLPLFALILKLLYFRRKKFFYVDHGIFSIYHYIFTFFLLLIVFAVDKISKLTGYDSLDYLTLFLFLSGGVYLYLSMKRFYGQGHPKTILKFILLNIAGVIMINVLFLLLMFFSVLKV